LKLDVSTGAIQQFSTVSAASFYLECITADGEWLLLRGQSQVIWVDAHSGAQKALDFPENAFLVDGQ
jgi:hypothetical protein